jgi:hypothetical protein
MKIYILIIIITLTHTFHILTYILMTQFFIRLPGEAQKIERIMDAFSAQFHANNPWSFRHADTAFKLAYSVIFFSHNPLSFGTLALPPNLRSRS